MQEIYYPSCDGKTEIHAYIWQPAGEPKAVVQIIHGMAEYALRYSAFAEVLAQNGFVVCAEDHLGHGKSVNGEENLGYFAEEKGYQPVLTDIRELTLRVRKSYPSLPYFVMGHSMGSFFCRKYIALYGKEFAGAVIMGTGMVSSSTLRSAKAATRTVALFKGWKHRSKFINNVAFGEYNQKFEKRTQFDWLSKDKKNVDRYIEDPLCGVTFTCNAFYGLFSIISEACKTKTIKAVPKRLPVIIVSGSDDPVGDYGKGVEKFYKKMEGHGKRVKMILYDGCRHEILNDVCAQKVTEDLLNFFFQIVG